MLVKQKISLKPNLRDGLLLRMCTSHKTAHVPAPEETWTSVLTQQMGSLTVDSMIWQTVKQPSQLTKPHLQAWDYNPEQLCVQLEHFIYVDCFVNGLAIETDMLHE